MSYHRTLPTGTILPFGGTNPPNGWLLCDGSSRLRSTYPKLYAAIATNWGVGDGADTFSLPDLRGLFCRGFDALSATGALSDRDPAKASRTHIKTGAVVGNVVGSYQGHAQQTHNHGNSSYTNDVYISHNHSTSFPEPNEHDHAPSFSSFGGNDHFTHNHSVTYPYRDQITTGDTYDESMRPFELTDSGEQNLTVTSSNEGSHSHTATISNSQSHGHGNVPTANVSHAHSTDDQTSKAPTLVQTDATVTSEVFPNNAYVNFIIKI